MGVETRGTVHMRGEAGPGVAVEVVADGSRLSLLSGPELIGEWDTSSIGIKALDDGFAIRAEGEEIILKTDDDVSVALEIGVSTASPRMARRVAASQNPEEPTLPPEQEPARSNLGAIVFALGGVLVLSGGFFLREDPTLSSARRSIAEGLGAEGLYWFAFVIAGLVMAGVSLVLAIATRWARVAAALVMVALVVLFGIAAQSATPEADHLLAYGFIAGGIVAGLAVLFGGSLGSD